jgi:hypothetical protein
MDGTSVLSADVFCANFFAYCDVASYFDGGVPYATMYDCVQAYIGLSTATKNCRAYHLCYNVEGITTGAPLPAAHCLHAAGMVTCM